MNRKYLLGLVPFLLLIGAPAFAKDYALPPRALNDAYVLKDVVIGKYQKPLFVLGYSTSWFVIPVSKTGVNKDNVHVAYFGKTQMLPKPGQTCDIAYHTSFTDGASTPDGNIRIPNKILDTFSCKTV